MAPIVPAGAQCIARHATDQRAHHGAGARGALALVDGFIAADLLRHAHLLHHRHRLQHARALLGLDHAASQPGCRHGAPCQPLSDFHGMLLVQSVHLV